ncbi:MAG: N-acetyltransferase [Muribaculaceae bacterium]|nr:N-acetyltransferase [Muribaculaceae bacterium]
MSTQEIVIRPVSPSDTDQISEIYNSYITNTTVSFETTPLSTARMAQRIAEISAANPYLVATAGNRILGYAYVHPWKERPAYFKTAETTIYLSPQAQHAGIGSALMKHLILLCRQSNLHTLIACITAENTASCRFHEKLGFEKTSHFKQVGYKFGRYLDVIDYQLIL